MAATDRAAETRAAGKTRRDETWRVFAFDWLLDGGKTTLKKAAEIDPETLDKVIIND